MNDWLLLNFIEAPLGEFQFGWTIPKAVGGAVVRNKFKRWIREYFQMQLDFSFGSNGLQSPGVHLQVVLFGKKKEAMERFERAEFFARLDVGLKRVFRGLAK